MTKDNLSKPSSQGPSLQTDLKEVITKITKIQEIGRSLNLGSSTAQLKAFTQFQARIQECLQPFAQSQELLNRAFASATRPIAAQLEAITQLQTRIQESLQPFAQFQERLNQTLSATGPIVAQLTAFTKFQARIQEGLLPFAQSQELLNRMFSTTAPFAAQLRELTPLQAKLDFEKILPIIKNAIDEASESQVRIWPQGDVVANGTAIPIEEVRRRTDEFLMNSQHFSDLFTGQGTLESNVEEILSEIKKQNSPLRFILLQVLVTLLTTLLVNAAFPLVQDLLHRNIFNKKQAMEIVKREANLLDLKPEHLRNVRLVTATILMVREKPNKISKPLGKLYNGQLVRIIKKSRKWSFIEYFEENKTWQGWVFSRYLQRLDTKIK